MESFSLWSSLSWYYLSIDEYWCITTKGCHASYDGKKPCLGSTHFENFVTWFVDRTQTVRPTFFPLRSSVCPSVRVLILTFSLLFIHFLIIHIFIYILSIHSYIYLLICAHLFISMKTCLYGFIALSSLCSYLSSSVITLYGNNFSLERLHLRLTLCSCAYFVRMHQLMKLYFDVLNQRKTYVIESCNAGYHCPF